MRERMLEERENRVRCLKESIMKQIGGETYDVAIRALGQAKGELVAEGESFLGAKTVKELTD